MSKSYAPAPIQQKTVESLFKPDRGYCYQVPIYQRPFSWNQTIAEEFIIDLIEAWKNEDPLFIGSVILVDKSEDKIYEIVDGQQRMLNLTILLAVIRDIFKGYMQRERNAAAIDDLIIAKNVGFESSAILTPDEGLKDFFKEYIQDPPSNIEEVSKARIWDLKEIVKDKNDDEVVKTTKENKPLYNSFTKQQKSIVDTYWIYRKEILIRVLNSESNAKSKSALEAFYNSGIRETFLALITVDNEDKADQIFEAINSKRAELTKADQIKAKIIGQIKIYSKLNPNIKDEKAELNRAKDSWHEIEDIAERSGIQLKAFLSYYWASEYGYVSDRMIFKETKKKFDDENDEKKTAKDWSTFLENLNDCSGDLESITNCEFENLKNRFKLEQKDVKELQNTIKTLNAVKNKTWLIIMFAVLRNKREGKYSSEIYKQLRKLTIFTFIYFAVTGQAGNWYHLELWKLAKNIDDLCDKGGKNTKQKIGDFWADFFEKCKNKLPNEEDFINSFVENVKYSNSTSSRDILRFVFGFIEKEFGNIPNIWDCSLEHILPQDPKLWNLKARDIKSEKNKIGNLMIISAKENHDLSNNHFDDKKEVYKKSNFRLAVNSDLALIRNNDDYYNFKACTHKDFGSIDRRGRDIAKFLYHHWVENFGNL